MHSTACDDVLLDVFPRRHRRLDRRPRTRTAMAMPRRCRGQDAHGSLILPDSPGENSRRRGNSPHFAYSAAILDRQDGQRPTRAAVFELLLPSCGWARLRPPSLDPGPRRRTMIVTSIVLTAQLSWAVLMPAALAASGSSAQAAAAPLTLSAAVAQARTASPRREAAVLVAAGARDAARVADKWPNPLFELRTENWTASRRPVSPDLDVFAVVTQPFELGGKRGIRRQLAASESDVALMALASLERELALEAVRAYIRALKARALVETLTANREGLTTLVTTVGRRVDEGYSAEADLLKFQTEAARVDGDIARARLELERSITALSIVTGAAAPVDPSQLVEPLPLAVPAADAERIAASIAGHPDVRAATAGVERARQVTAFERARRLPDPFVTGGYKRTAGFDTMVFGVSVAVPLFDRNLASVARSTGVELGAMADRDALVRRLTSDTASVIRAAQTIADQANQVPHQLLAPAEDVRRAALAAFREGTADVLKLIDAERVYADVHRAAIDLRLDALLATIEARFALGEETIP